MLTVILWHISTQTKQLCDQQLSLWCLKPMQCVCTSMYQWSVGSPPYNCSRVLYLDEAIIRPATLTWFNQLLASGASYIPIWLDRNFSTNVSMLWVGLYLLTSPGCLLKWHFGLNWIANQSLQEMIKYFETFTASVSIYCSILCHLAEDCS